jgi:hypothetical protein
MRIDRHPLLVNRSIDRLAKIIAKVRNRYYTINSFATGHSLRFLTLVRTTMKRLAVTDTACPADSFQLRCQPDSVPRGFTALPSLHPVNASKATFNVYRN